MREIRGIEARPRVLDVVDDGAPGALPRGPRELIPSVDRLADRAVCLKFRDQLKGTPGEQLCELAGRCCYDSLGQGRSSADYWKHILQVRHLCYDSETEVLTADGWRPLPEVIAAAPEPVLGAEVARRHGGELPFLFKLLALNLAFGLLGFVVNRIMTRVRCDPLLLALIAIPLWPALGRYIDLQQVFAATSAGSRASSISRDGRAKASTRRAFRATSAVVLWRRSPVSAAPPRHPPNAGKKPSWRNAP